MPGIAQTPEPPYYAVIFTSKLNENAQGYEDMADKMLSLALQQPGFLGFETARDGIGLSISYWSDLDSIKRWKEHSEHRVAQQLGREFWYKNIKTRIARVERDYD